MIVGDPAIGQRTLTHNEFKAGWTGYALLLQPTAMLNENQEGITPFWQFFDLVKPHSQVLLEVFYRFSIDSGVWTDYSPIHPVAFRPRSCTQGSTLTLNAVGLGLIIFGLFRVAINGLRQYLLDHTANRISVSAIGRFY